jgi:hypothetical protein
MSLESRLKQIERALAIHSGDNPAQKNQRTIGDLLPEYGPTLLSAAKVMLEADPPAPAQAEAELAGLDAWVAEHYGPEGFTWPEYTVFKSALEALVSCHGELR